MWVAFGSTAALIAVTVAACSLIGTSIGPAFPAIVVGRGVNPTVWEVHLGAEISGQFIYSEYAHSYANIIGDVCRSEGYAEAVKQVRQDRLIWEASTGRGKV